MVAASPRSGGFGFWALAFSGLVFQGVGLYDFRV